MENNLFNFNQKNEFSPLAERMRPTTLDNFVGQSHILGEGKLLNRLVKTGTIGSSIFFGPPGTGKTTLATIIANGTGANFVKLNAVSSGVSDAKAVIEKAKSELEMFGKKTYLLLDECHRWSKAQSDCVLSAIEQGYITFIGSTTENPFYSMTRAIVSRCRVFEFKPLTSKDIKSAVMRALIDETNGLGAYKIEMSDDSVNTLVQNSGGDLRFALNSLELAIKSTDGDSSGKVTITPEIIAECTGGRVLSIDEDMYYDMLSAFGKSLRGSDPDGAVYWAFRLIESGVDPQVVARRLIAHTSEDVGLANSNALVVAVSALTAYQNLGIPEGLIPLTHAIICTATSPKSNAVVMAKDSAIDSVHKTEADPVPDHLKNYNFLNEKRAKYKYPHDFGGYVKQQYLPESLKDTKFYTPTDNGNERKIKEFLAQIRENIYGIKEGGGLSSNADCLDTQNARKSESLTTSDIENGAENDKTHKSTNTFQQLHFKSSNQNPHKK